LLLRPYRSKRNFERTAEPEGRITKTKQRRFVIQKHDATRLHYDFRLELGGTLKSWAIPKGIPFRKGEKRLAMQVEDHPLDYRTFEGAIPKGQYGGGTVMVWDQGTFEPLGSASPAKDLDAGKLHFNLHGAKLEGEWALVQMHGGGKEWLLIKSGANLKPVSKKMDDCSALSGRSMSQIGKSPSAVWHSKPAGRAKKSRLRFIEPMKAKQVDRPPAGDGWEYELKFDGYRALALKEGRAVKLLSSNGKDFNERFPEIVEGVARLPGRGLILDGEIVAFDPKGRSSFQKLQAYALGEEKPPLAFYVFDLLHENGRDLLRERWTERRVRLEECLRDAGEPVRFSAALGKDAPKLLKEVARLGLEGLIGKREISAYEPGGRSGAWVKLKCLQMQEFVIGGYTPPGGTRTYFGALLIGYYEGRRLIFCGKAGTGFDHAVLKMLHAKMKELEQTACPFANLPETKSSRWSPTLTAREMKRCHWVRPALVAQIRFTEWTDDGKLRHPVFLGLREDKTPRQVRRERPAKP